MNAVLPGLFLGLAGISLVLAAAIQYVALQEARIRGLRAIAASYAISALRYLALGSASVLGGSATLVADLMLVLSSVLLTFGALRMAGAAQRERLLAAVAVAGTALSLAQAYGAFGRDVAQITFSMLGAAAHLVFAWALYRLARDSKSIGYFIAASLVVALAALRLLLPVLLRAGLAPLMVLLATVLYLGAALAFVVALQQSQLAEMKIARRRALEAKRLAHIVFNNTADLMAVARVEPGGRFAIEHANRSLLRAIKGAYPGTVVDVQSGRDLEEVLARDFGLTAPETASMLAHFSKTVQTQTTQTFSARVGPRQQEAVLTPVSDADGRISHVFYRGTDVTEAREAQRGFERVFNLSPVPLVITRLEDGRYLEVNDAWVAFRGCSREHALQRNSVELGIWADAGGRSQMLKALEETGRVLNGVTVFRKEDGSTVDSIYSAELIEWHGTRAVLTAIQDVSEIAHARREAQASSERLARLFESSPVPVLITRLADGTILEANRAFLDFAGAERDTVLGRTTLDVGVWPDNLSREQLTGRLCESGTVRGLPVQMRMGASGARHVLLSAEVIDWRGEPAIIGFQIDVTSMRQAAEEIERLNASLEERVQVRTAELEQALAEMEGFTYSVSHDLRAPLRAMTSFAGLLAQCPPVAADPQANAYAWRVSRAASRMGRMVDGLLRYAELGRQPIKPRPVSLAAEVSAIAAALDEQGAGRRLHWEIGPLPEVHADPALLRLVLHNVIDNAVKYTRSREEARIEVSARLADRAVEVTVRDNGIGFDMAYAAKLFAPFERLHDAAEYDGTGIGLAHARRIVERHGGRMWCEAAPGNGAAFTLSLPH